MGDDDMDATQVEVPASRSSRHRPYAGMAVGERVRLKEPLGRGGMAEVWVADHLTLEVEVAVKFLRVDDSALMRERFAREAQLAARIDHPHAVKVFDHGLTEDGSPFMVMERVDGESLATRILQTGPIAPDEVRVVVDQMARVLAHAHQQGIIHRDVKPSNVMLLRGDRPFAKVLDFGLAKVLLEEEDDPALTEAGWVLGTPAYMAPEQLVDAKPATARSDEWALAVLAYEALTGKRPFLGRQQAAIALAMLTQRFRPPSEVAPGLPPSLDAFFQRALAVDPAERFADVGDLSEALGVALSGSSKVVFRDGRIHLPNRLYGREPELRRIASGLAATRDASRWMLLDGYAGAGKTALIDEARRRVGETGAIVADGKFDQLHRGAPYEALLEALRKLVRSLLAEDAAYWRTRLEEALGDSASALADLLPELDELLGTQPVSTEAPPSEMRNRLQSALRLLLHGIGEAGRPVWLFLDDLQWADLPTLELLPALLLGPEDRDVFIVGSYRSNEVDLNHPLHGTIQRLRAGPAPVDELTVAPLGEDAVLEMLNDALGPGPGRVRLAVLCHEKTRGNPFFLRRFLETLHEESILQREPDSGTWRWSSSQVLSRPMGDDVIAFIAEEMRRLPEETAHALAIASCVGSQFDLGTLAHLGGVHRRRALELLRPALTAHLIVPDAEDVWGSTEVGPRRITFRFAHDHFQKAARSLLPDDDAARVHQQTAELLLAHLDPQERERRLFELVEHLNQSAALQPVAEPARLRDLNLDAARRASRSAAIEPAADYYRRAIALFDETQWSEDYEAAFELHLEAARAEVAIGDPEASARLIATAVDHARDPVDAVRVREVRIHGLIQAQRFGDAVNLALELLEALGFERPDPGKTEAVVGATVERAGGLTAEAIDGLVRTDDARVALAQRIRLGVMSAAYLSAPAIFPLLPCAIVETTLEQGATDESAYGFAVFAMVLNAIGLIDLSYATGRHALALLEHTDDRAMIAKTRHVFNAHIAPFVEPVRDTIEREREIYQLGRDAGDLEYACWALHIMVAHGFYGGLDLPTLETMDARNVALIRQHGQAPALGCALPFSQLIRNLVGDDIDESSQLRGPDYDGAVHMEELTAAGFRGAAYILTVAQTFVAFLFRDVERALETADAGAGLADGAGSTMHLVWWAQYRALSLLAARGADGLEGAREGLEKLRHWCASSEVNHAHRVSLLEAEIARIEGRDGDALGGYDAAIAHARAQGFIHEEALANELAGRFYLDRGSETAARAYLLEARDGYATWGARAKVEHLEVELGAVLRKRR